MFKPCAWPGPALLDPLAGEMRAKQVLECADDVDRQLPPICSPI
jgi:hypothetical protein